ncbi:glycoside hydrolase family 16 protein [Ramaria rubella]|nr:glycoside hydrolase family 16 protein [Ramaria rubella]
MAVDTTQTITGNRQSIRITTNYQFTGGLLVLDAVHAPTGCGTWPAFWSNGPNWPNNGEIDIMEGVNDVSVNQASIHTAPGCQISNSEATNNASGTLVGGSNCASAESNNGGCGQQATSLNNTYGTGFNSNGGGVYAMVWDESGVAVYFFPRQTVPPDITGMAPQPQTWGVPFARWPATNCNPFQFFQQHSVIFDTTLCGDWAGNVWSTAGAPGQEQSCAQRTGFATCADFVQNSGSSFAQAYWEVRSVRLYQKS